MTLVLASGSLSRREMLSAAGVAFEVQPAVMDERGFELGLADQSPGAVALALAEAKALAVSRLRPGALVLGSDSLVEVAGRRFDKPSSRENAAEHLRLFSDKSMTLHSAAALARDGAVVWSHGEHATLHVRVLSEAFIAAYLAAEWPAVGACVGAFRIEAMGVQLFENIEGSHFTVLGMPLLPVLAALREQTELAS
jgi:septum formation protein